MILAATGHRPDKLGGYGDDVFDRLVRLAKASLKERFQPAHVISGMAPGWDQAVAQAAVELSIPFTAAVPFDGQHMKWPWKSQVTYLCLLRQAQHVEIVCEGEYEPWKFQKRNEWMVDRATEMMALWNGVPSGGTYNCIVYATDHKVNVWNVWPLWEPVA